MTNTKTTRWFEVPGFCLHEAKVIRIDVYKNLSGLRKSIGNKDAFGMWKLYAKRQDRNAVGRIAICQDACALIIVHESTHATRDLLSWLDWNDCDQEEEELIADTAAEIAVAISRVLKNFKSPLCAS
jgi:hypothetical protein